MLAGSEMPTAVIQSVLTGFQGKGNMVGVVNLTPYDGHMESVCVHWKQKHGQDEPILRCFSYGDNPEEVLFSERLVANQLLQEIWYSNMGTLHTKIDIFDIIVSSRYGKSFDSVLTSSIVGIDSFDKSIQY